MKKTILTLSALTLAMGLLVGCSKETEESETQKITTEESTTTKAAKEKSTTTKAAAEVSTNEKTTTEDSSATQAAAEESTTIKTSTEGSTTTQAAVKESTTIQAATNVGSSTQAATKESTTAKATTKESTTIQATTKETTTTKAATETTSSKEETTVKELTREDKIAAFVDSIDVKELDNSLVCPLCGKELLIGKGGYDDPDTGEFMSEDDLFCETYDFILSYTIKNGNRVIYYLNWIQDGEVFEYGTDYSGLWAADIEKHRK